MFRKLLRKALSKHFEKTSPRKENARDSILEIESEAPEKLKVKKRRKNKMADEKDVKKDIDSEKEEIKKSEVEETKEEKESNGEEIKTEDKKEVATKSEEDETPAKDEPTEKVEELGNEVEGIRVEDLVTKDVFEAKLAAFEAKFNSVVKENEDLKNKLSEMKDKYETKDFGNMQRKGMNEVSKSANSTFDEYSRQFM